MEFTTDAHAYVLGFEKGTVNDPADKGGFTYDGITQGLLHYLNIPELTVQDLVNRGSTWDIYCLLWHKEGLDKFNSLVHVKLFDTIVNMGVVQAVELAQISLNRTLPATQLLKVDGILGPQTKHELSVIRERDLEVFYSIFCGEQAAVYRWLSKKDPTQGRFILGWLRRAYSTPGSIVTVSRAKKLLWKSQQR